MSCSEVQAWLVDLLYEEVGAEERSALHTHLQMCAECWGQWSRLQALSDAATRWTAPPPPRGIGERALARISREQAREARPEWSQLSPAETLRGVVLGAGAAIVSLLLVVGIVDARVAALTIAVLAVLWTVLYSGALFTLSQRRLRPLALSALTAAGLALLLVPPLSIPSVVEACERWVQAGPGSAPFALLLLVLAAGYTAGPLLVGGLAFGGPGRTRSPAQAATLSLLYLLLIAPAVYLQCVALPLNVTALWMAGAIFGAALAGPASLWLHAWRSGSA